MNVLKKQLLWSLFL